VDRPDQPISRKILVEIVRRSLRPMIQHEILNISFEKSAENGNVLWMRFIKLMGTKKPQVAGSRALIIIS